MIFYFDEMMPRRVANELISRGHQVLMAVDEGMVEKNDLTDHLPYASQKAAVLVTADRPFAGRATNITSHNGVICWTGPLTDIGGMIQALTDFASNTPAASTAGRVYWLK